MEKWPALPFGVRLLSNTELEHLRKSDDNIPKSPADCITCRGEGSFRWWYIRSDERVIAEYECPCADQWIAHLYMRHCGVPKAYQRLSRFDIERIDPYIVDQVKEYANNAQALTRRGISLILRGDRGTGKTLLSALLIKHLIADGFDCYFSTFSEMIDLYASGWRSDDERQWFHKRALNTSILVIDDIGREKKKTNSGLGVQVLEGIIRHRVSESLPTIITTNETNTTLLQTYGSHFMSLADEVARHIVFSGEDWRPELNKRAAFEVAHDLTRPISVGRL